MYGMQFCRCIRRNLCSSFICCCTYFMALSILLWKNFPLFSNCCGNDHWNSERDGLVLIDCIFDRLRLWQQLYDYTKKWASWTWRTFNILNRSSCVGINDWRLQLYKWFLSISWSYSSLLYMVPTINVYSIHDALTPCCYYGRNL